MRQSCPSGKEKQTAISFSKVDWSSFNASAFRHLHDFFANNPVPMSHSRQVHYYDRALRFAFNEAKKELPQGCRPDPIMWCTDHLEEMLEARNEAWATAIGTNNIEDWQHYLETSKAFSEELRTEKTKAWEQFCDTLNYASDPTKTMKVLKAINRQPEGATPNSVLNSPNGRPVTSPKGKANLFRKHFAKVSR